MRRMNELTPEMTIPEAAETWNFTDPYSLTRYMDIKKWKTEDTLADHGYTESMLREIKEAEEALQENLN